MKILYKTNRFFLTPFNRDVAKNSNYENWFYDPEVTKYNHWGLFPHSKEEEKDFLDMCESGKKDIVLSIIFENDFCPYTPEDYDYSEVNKKIYKHIGNISLQSINWIYRSAEFAIIIGEKDYWKMGIGYESLLLLLHHGFDKLNLHRIWTGTASMNIGMKKLANKLGMKEEGIFRDGLFINGEFVNIIQYSILENEWRIRK